MTFLQEAAARWRSGTPPWFIKTQKVLVAAGGMFTAVAGISFAGKLAVVGTIAATLAGICGGGVILANFVVTTAGIILEPGDSIENKSQSTVEVKPVDNIPPPNQAAPPN